MSSGSFMCTFFLEQLLKFECKKIVIAIFIIVNSLSNVSKVKYIDKIAGSILVWTVDWAVFFKFS